LLGRVGAREAKNDAVLSKKIAVGDIIKFAAIISLDRKNGALKLCVDIGEKVSKNLVNLRFATKRKSPGIMRKIIKYNKIVFVL
jgi:hypothetical protein